MCDCPDKDIKFPKWSCVLNCCSECTDVFVPDAEMNGDEDVELKFIQFHNYKMQALVLCTNSYYLIMVIYFSYMSIENV